MSETEITRRVLLTGLLALLSITIALVMLLGVSNFPFPGPFQHGIRSPILAVELAADPDELCDVLGTKHPGLRSLNDSEMNSSLRTEREADPYLAAQATALVNANTRQDLLFIPSYVLFVYSLASLVVATSAGKRSGLSQFVGLLILVAAIFDYLEDRGIFISLRAQTLDAAVISHTRVVSLSKWSLIGVSLLLVGYILLRATDTLYGRTLRAGMASLAIVAGALVLIGTRAPMLMVGANLLFALLFLLNAAYLLSRCYRGQVLLAQGWVQISKSKDDSDI